MRTGRLKNSMSSWPKMVVRTWLNIKSGLDEVHSDSMMRALVERRKSCSEKGLYVVVPEDFSEGCLMESSDGVERSRLETEGPTVTITRDLRMVVGTWNVGGKPPSEGMKLGDLLRPAAPADIYVLGFQEIVPLNACNVLGAEESGPASKWLSLVGQALNNNNQNDPKLPHYYNHATVRVPKQPPQHDQQHTSPKHRISFSDLQSLQEDCKRLFSINSDSNLGEDSSLSLPTMSTGHTGSPVQQQHYCLLASKQMGSVSISMTMHQTTFCFVCTHLASGEKEGDEARRNSDVTEILKKTRFSHSCGALPVTPASILDHDKIIWLGDLNYRLAPGCGDTQELLTKHDWQALLEKDQLKMEQRAGRVFKDWEEGVIYFAPTYKYLPNSDHYVVETSTSKEKLRIPAWCDRILWKGEGLKQMWYRRVESKFSDHRPVYSLFSVQINEAKKPKPISSRSPTYLGLAPRCVAQVQAEELLFPGRAQSCIQIIPRF